MVLVIITSGKALGTGPGCEMFLIDISYYYHFYYHFYYHTTKPQATRSHVRVKTKVLEMKLTYQEEPRQENMWPQKEGDRKDITLLPSYFRKIQSIPTVGCLEVL